MDEVLDSGRFLRHTQLVRARLARMRRDAPAENQRLRFNVACSAAPELVRFPADALRAAA